MKNGFKFCFCLMLMALNTPVLLAQQPADALIITPQGNVNVVSGNLNVEKGKVQEGGNDLLPKGSIILWYGTAADAPQGWGICDGSLYVREANEKQYRKIFKSDEGKYTNVPDKIKTPDLSGRFVVGAGGNGQYQIPSANFDTPEKRMGGNATITLTENNLPAHSHGVDLKTGDKIDTYDNPSMNVSGLHYSDSSNGTNSPTLLYYNNNNNSSNRIRYFPISNAQHTHAVQGDTKSTGGGQAFDNRPPFYALYYIMKL